jgi:hypothetical protein
MPTYRTGAAAQNRSFKPFPDGTVGIRKQRFTFPVAPQAGDIVEMIPVYEGETVVSVTLVTEDLDSGSTITLSVGDGDVAGRYINASTVGRTGGFAQLGSGVTGVPTFPYTYPADDTIDVRVPAGPTGGIAAAVTLIVEVA